MLSHGVVNAYLLSTFLHPMTASNVFRGRIAAACGRPLPWRNKAIDISYYHLLVGYIAQLNYYNLLDLRDKSLAVISPASSCKGHAISSMRADVLAGTMYQDSKLKERRRKGRKGKRHENTRRVTVKEFLQGGRTIMGSSLVQGVGTQCIL